jgi:hypothetical protein
VSSYADKISDVVVWLSNLHPILSQWIAYATNVRPPVRIIGGILLFLVILFVISFLVRGLWSLEARPCPAAFAKSRRWKDGFLKNIFD